MKFEDENLIFALIRSTIKKSLGIYNVAPSLDFERNEQMDSFFRQKQMKSNPVITAQNFTSTEILIRLKTKSLLKNQ